MEDYITLSSEYTSYCFKKFYSQISLKFHAKCNLLAYAVTIRR